MGADICHKDRKVWCKELKSRDVYLYKFLDRQQLHIQSGCVEKVIHDLHSPATSVPVPDDPKDEACLPRKQSSCAVCGDSHRWLWTLEVPKLQVCGL